MGFSKHGRRCCSDERRAYDLTLRHFEDDSHEWPSLYDNAVRTWYVGAGVNGREPVKCLGFGCVPAGRQRVVLAPWCSE
jgi:hypothetical protein